MSRNGSPFILSPSKSKPSLFSFLGQSNSADFLLGNKKLLAFFNFLIFLVLFTSFLDCIVKLVSHFSFFLWFFCTSKVLKLSSLLFYLNLVSPRTHFFSFGSFLFSLCCLYLDCNSNKVVFFALFQEPILLFLHWALIWEYFVFSCMIKLSPFCYFCLSFSSSRLDFALWIVSGVCFHLEKLENGRSFIKCSIGSLS